MRRLALDTFASIVDKLSLRQVIVFYTFGACHCKSPEKRSAILNMDHLLEEAGYLNRNRKCRTIAWRLDRAPGLRRMGTREAPAVALPTVQHACAVVYDS